MIDPFTKVAGQGFARLRAAGIEVETGVLQHTARSINEPFVKLVTTGMPYVHAKWGMTLDGKIATAAGESKWITSEASRAVAHELRGRMDAILVGVGTALRDDPLLTARPAGPRTATRIIFDSRARLPLCSRLVATAADVPVIVITSAAASRDAVAALRTSGCECLILPTDEHGIALEPLLHELGNRKMTNILVEGGSRLLGRFHDSNSIDELHVFIAAKIVGGTAITAVAGRGVMRIDQASGFELTEVRRIGDDCLLRARRNFMS
jgi:diaminohydroxyphosphoribosylaminopyrimidine deaminase/5-amino-6-(5-phosphoribosylamino)uracil reductase